MKTINALALINDIIEEINENGFQPDMVVTQLKELRGHALEEKNPVATKALRLAYEHITLHQEFAIQYMGEEDEDEDEEDEAVVIEEKETASTQDANASTEDADALKEEGEIEGNAAEEIVEEPEPEEEDDNFGYFLELIRAAENRFNRAELLDIIKMLQEYE
ncbi:MAG: hypothetical protein ACPG49_05340 [Chitinophagales bacterium]